MSFKDVIDCFIAVGVLWLVVAFIKILSLIPFVHDYMSNMSIGSSILAALISFCIAGVVWLVCHGVYEERR